MVFTIITYITSLLEGLLEGTSMVFTIITYYNHVRRHLYGVYHHNLLHLNGVYHHNLLQAC